MHLLSPRARRGPPGRRYARGLRYFKKFVKSRRYVGTLNCNSTDFKKIRQMKVVIFTRNSTKVLKASLSLVPGKTQCPICHSYFSKNTDLKRHIETVHEGQKTQCPTCQALFSRKTDLKRHIETVHEGKRTHCHLCSASFSRKTDLKRHVETVHEGKRTLCPNCSASFSRKTGLKQHIETVHEREKNTV